MSSCFLSCVVIYFFFYSLSYYFLLNLPLLFILLSYMLRTVNTDPIFKHLQVLQCLLCHLTRLTFCYFWMTRTLFWPFFFYPYSVIYSSYHILLYKYLYNTTQNVLKRSLRYHHSSSLAAFQFLLEILIVILPITTYC